MAYIDIPQEISYKEVCDNEGNLSSNTYKKLLMKNTNFKTLGELLKDFQSGKEIGSLAYVKNSNFLFLRTKALNSHLFCLDFHTQGASECIKPHSYELNFKQNMKLEKNNILFVTGGNVGEVAFIDEGLENIIFSSHLIKLEILENPHYVFALLKHNISKEQVNFSPTGAIKGLDTFKIDYILNCKIPFPNTNAKESIKFIELLTKSIIIKEKLIKQRHERILSLIESELLNNQLPNTFHYAYPTFKELLESARLDTGIYCEEFKKLDFLIKNYKFGVFYIDEKKIKSGSTPKQRFIGKAEFLPYQWITPTHCSDYGTIKEVERINFIGKPNLTQDCILISNATSKGGKGEFVGIATFYNYKESGKAQYNQQLYKLTDDDMTKLLFMLSFLNCKITRKICSYLCVGSKMKGMKIEHFLQIPFPKFPQNLQEQIALLYHNPHAKLEYENLTLTNFEKLDTEFYQNAGIYELDKSIKHLKNILDSNIDSIINNKEVKINFIK